ncbi:5'/3'-nucleotidase SurE [Commensalibacter melissae]|uniref:5'/3'-nucleotidase SurE n=1 Tax=Commensalibacter melissae TaxID=2070537 RepID=UPI0012D928C2|nr:5'/3'-nucleotidase SurE [Commensalibacter melissae]MUG09073.1 5'/3'-nucleotidase SurE [Commensalibacter melissae]
MNFQLLNNVLLTNDDGIDAPGLKILENIASKIAKTIWVIAPERDQSGTAQSISIHHPLRIMKKSNNHFAISGTPGDCVVMGIQEILPQRPDLVLSGVNRGSNLGIETIFSGTVGAAMTGALLGIPSIALSQNFRDGYPVQWNTAEYFGAKIIEQILEHKKNLKNGCININFPDCQYDEVNTIEYTTQGLGYIENIVPVKRKDLRQNEYFWLNFDRPIKEDKIGTETQAINNKSISITPLTYERTDFDLLNQLKK